MKVVEIVFWMLALFAISAIMAVWFALGIAILWMGSWCILVGIGILFLWLIAVSLISAKVNI